MFILLCIVNPLHHSVGNTTDIYFKEIHEFYVIDTYMYIGLLRVYIACIALQGIAYNQCYEILKNVCDPNFVIFLLLNCTLQHLLHTICSFLSAMLIFDLIKTKLTQLLFVVKATALKQQMSKFCLQIQRTDSSDTYNI